MIEHDTFQVVCPSHPDHRAKNAQIQAPDDEAAALCWGAMYGGYEATDPKRHSVRVGAKVFRVCRNIMGVSVETAEGN